MRGSIHSPEAYAQGKMLDHSRWAGELPRNITPSDVDMVIESGGYTMYCELSSQYNNWPFLALGQRKMYESFVRFNPNRSICVLLYHRTPLDKQVDTFGGIESASIMVGCNQKELLFGSSKAYQWPDLAVRFTRFPDSVITLVRTHLRSRA